MVQRGHKIIAFSATFSALLHHDARQMSTCCDPLLMHQNASISDNSSSELSNECIPMVDEHGVRLMSSASSSTPLPSSTLKAKPIGKWSRDAQMALLEAPNKFGIWEYKSGLEKAKFCCIAEELMERYGLVHSIDAIQHAYRALLAQAINVSLQDSRKMGEAKPDDVVLSLAFKLHKQTKESCISYKVSFFYLVH